MGNPEESDGMPNEDGQGEDGDPGEAGGGQSDSGLYNDGGGQSNSGSSNDGGGSGDSRPSNDGGGMGMKYINKNAVPDKKGAAFVRS